MCDGVRLRQRIDADTGSVRVHAWSLLEMYSWIAMHDEVCSMMRTDVLTKSIPDANKSSVRLYAQHLLEVFSWPRTHEEICMIMRRNTSTETDCMADTEMFRSRQRECM